MVGYYVTTYLSMILFKLIGVEKFEALEWNQILFQNVLGILLLFFTFGLLFILGFYSAIACLDLIGFNVKTYTVKSILLIEYLVITPPFIKWAFEYDYWLWLTLSLSFAVTQWIRKKKLEQIDRLRAKN